MHLKTLAVTALATLACAGTATAAQAPTLGAPTTFKAGQTTPVDIAGNHLHHGQTIRKGTRLLRWKVTMHGASNARVTLSLPGRHEARRPRHPRPPEDHLQGRQGLVVRAPHDQGAVLRRPRRREPRRRDGPHLRALQGLSADRCGRRAGAGAPARCQLGTGLMSRCSPPPRPARRRARARRSACASCAAPYTARPCRTLASCRASRIPTRSTSSPRTPTATRCCRSSRPARGRPTGPSATASSASSAPTCATRRDGQMVATYPTLAGRPVVIELTYEVAPPQSVRRLLAPAQPDRGARRRHAQHARARRHRLARVASPRLARPGRRRRPLARRSVVGAGGLARVRRAEEPVEARVAGRRVAHDDALAAQRLGDLALERELDDRHVVAGAAVVAIGQRAAVEDVVAVAAADEVGRAAAEDDVVAGAAVGDAVAELVGVLARGDLRAAADDVVAGAAEDGAVGAATC